MKTQKETAKSIIDDDMEYLRRLQLKKESEKVKLKETRDTIDRQ